MKELTSKILAFFFPKFRKPKDRRPRHSSSVLDSINLEKELKKRKGSQVLLVVSPKLRNPACELAEYFCVDGEYEITIHVDPFFTGIGKEWEVLSISSNELESLKQIWSNFGEKKEK